ncbi:hypothetical protein V1517DRAFT_310398 [Lipomyces orientalis]|uniref:Uncharacterized protein n=1 Tax=Lipomyces orientalis TaxID=1233043 RepID=A0ACC3TG17_9ASCO
MHDALIELARRSCREAMISNAELRIASALSLFIVMASKYSATYVMEAYDWIISLSKITNERICRRKCEEKIYYASLRTALDEMFNQVSLIEYGNRRYNRWEPRDTYRIEEGKHVLIEKFKMPFIEKNNRVLSRAGSAPDLMALARVGLMSRVFGILTVLLYEVTITAFVPLVGFIISVYLANRLTAVQEGYAMALVSAVLTTAVISVFPSMSGLVAAVKMMATRKYCNAEELAKKMGLDYEDTVATLLAVDLVNGGISVTGPFNCIIFRGRSLEDGIAMTQPTKMSVYSKLGLDVLTFKRGHRMKVLVCIAGNPFAEGVENEKTYNGKKMIRLKDKLIESYDEINLDGYELYGTASSEDWLVGSEVRSYK